MRSCCRGWKRIFVDAVGPRARQKRPCVVPSSCSKTSRSTPQRWTSRSGTTWMANVIFTRKTTSLPCNGMACSTPWLLWWVGHGVFESPQAGAIGAWCSDGHGWGRLGTDGPSFVLRDNLAAECIPFESGGGKLVLHVVPTPSQTESCRIHLNAQQDTAGGIMALERKLTLAEGAF